MNNLLLKNISKQHNVLCEISKDTNFLENIISAGNILLQSFNKGGRVYIAGNGGSAADAQHLAAEFISKLAKDRNPLPAEALTVDSSVLTAISNDYGYEYIFSRQLVAKIKLNDIFIGITTSGNSLNIINAVETCNSLNKTSIILTGNKGGNIKNIVSNCIVVPSNDTAVIQQVHILILHTLCEYVEKNIFFN